MVRPTAERRRLIQAEDVAAPDEPPQSCDQTGPNADRVTALPLRRHGGRFPLPSDRYLKSAAIQSALFLSSGCSTSPAQNMFGSFFPAWMLCAAAGILIAVILRQTFGALGINPYLIAPPLTYASIAVAGTLVVWLLLFGH